MPPSRPLASLRGPLMPSLHPLTLFCRPSTFPLNSNCSVLLFNAFQCFSGSFQKPPLCHLLPQRRSLMPLSRTLAFPSEL